MPSKEDAIEHFMKLYEEKTGNAWHSKNFTKYPKKFYPLEIDYGQVITYTTQTLLMKGRNKLFKLHIMDWLASLVNTTKHLYEV